MRSSRLLRWAAGIALGAALVFVVAGTAGASCLSFSCEGGSYDGSGGSTGKGGNSTLGVAISAPSPGATVRLRRSTAVKSPYFFVKSLTSTTGPEEGAALG